MYAVAAFDVGINTVENMQIARNCAIYLHQNGICSCLAITLRSMCFSPVSTSRVDFLIVLFSPLQGK